jgi:hypothetical protein
MSVWAGHPRSLVLQACSGGWVGDSGGLEQRLAGRLVPAWSIPSLREPRYSQSLERGLTILGCFTPQRPVLGIADIADELVDALGPHLISTEAGISARLGFRREDEL